LGETEEVRQLTVAGPLGAPDQRLEANVIAQALLSEPDDAGISVSAVHTSFVIGSSHRP
jgi:hypothetical protein